MIKFIIICAVIYLVVKVVSKPKDHTSRVQAAGEKVIAFQKEIQKKYTKEQWDAACKELRSKT